MPTEQMEFPDARTAAATLEAMADVLAERSRARDKDGVRGLVPMITGALAAIERLSRRRRGAGPAAGLGKGLDPASFNSMTPDEVLIEAKDFFNSRKVSLKIKQMKKDGARSADQKRLQAQIDRTNKELKNGLRAAKENILKRRPELWNAELDYRFREYLS